MGDVPAERRATRRLDPGSADLDTQVELGWQEPPPEPPAEDQTPGDPPDAA